MDNTTPKSFGGSWSDDKLDVLKSYLGSYAQVLKKSNFTLVYIDAFAGAGKTALPTPDDGQLFDDTEIEGDIEGYRHGSPLIALASKPAFDQFVFIEQHEQSLNKLEKQVVETNLLQGRAVRFLREDANVALQKIAAESWQSRRAVAFLDPFALHVKWDTIKALAKTQAIDMWLLFPAMAVNRMLPKSGIVPDAWAKKLNETFGDESWRTTFFRKEHPDLFGDEPTMKLPDVFTKLSEYVTTRLKCEFAGVHEKPLVLPNSSGAPIFLLCFASGNPRGAPIAKRIAQHIINKKNHGH